MSKGIPELDKLFHDVSTYKNSFEFRKLLDFIKKFPKIAPFNAMLLHIQKPGSVYVASALAWNDRFGRIIKPEARPLVILQPFGPVSFLFDLSDTVGNKPFPDQLLNPFKVEGQISNAAIQTLISNLKCDGINYIEADYGTSLAGNIRNRSNKEKLIIHRANKEIRVKAFYDMVVNKNHEIETRFTTMLHELGHLYCGHLGTPYEKWWKSRTGLSINVCEFEAECVCWLVCERMGINNPSAAYLNGYLEMNEKIPDISTDTVLKAAGIIESMIHTTKSPRKEIIHTIKDLKTGKIENPVVKSGVQIQLFDNMH